MLILAQQIQDVLWCLRSGHTELASERVKYLRAVYCTNPKTRLPAPLRDAATIAVRVLNRRIWGK